MNATPNKGKSVGLTHKKKSTDFCTFDRLFNFVTGLN